MKNRTKRKGCGLLMRVCGFGNCCSSPTEGLRQLMSRERMSEENQQEQIPVSGERERETTSHDTNISKCVCVCVCVCVCRESNSRGQ